ncbi:HAMP domain-containing sensor histidine kinase [Solidesulfovibrio alcoholivorans]|uniref:HAMP domain-containing sensor histidine kinase n=1 Tax=Solidesulfovibrio alcoholivorans TaxID=81406 RepID=UPI000494DDB5|nr:HAMP domain-containing sensor histidine kinase [Solidesulfovibrio alcoholivorans]
MYLYRKPIKQYGLLFKMLAVYIGILVVAYFTTSTLLIYIKESVNISRDIVKVRFEVLSISQRLVDSLLSMEENQKKYEIMHSEEYKKNFLTALNEYKNAIWSILWFRYESFSVWEELHAEFRAAFPELAQGKALAGEPWIDQETLNKWMRIVISARQDNERVLESGMRELYRISEVAVSRGVTGLVVSIGLGLLGILYLTYSLRRPLRELRRGIRAYTRDGRLEPIRVLSNDELGELAQAFNDMTVRLKEEERMRADFIDMVSHEIRTPLTSIRESVNLMRERVLGEVNERQKRFLDIASDELQRISAMLTSLLKVSSMASQIVDLAPTPFDPEKLVLETLEKAAPAAEAKGIALTPRVGRDIVSVVGDRELLGQALYNLVGNAVKFSPPGRTVLVGLEMADGGRKLLVSTTDEGPGIAEEEQPHVFNKYYRGVRTKRTTDGIGLGLSIAKTIIEAHGGNIWLSSLPGKGCTFYFTIPVDGATA